jgi:hypothetical protein
VVAKADILRTKLVSLRRTIDRTGAKERSEHVSKATADHFNLILEQLKDLYPDLAPEFPRQVKTTGTFSSLGVCEISYLDLEIFCEQVLDLMALAAPQGGGESEVNNGDP